MPMKRWCIVVVLVSCAEIYSMRQEEAVPSKDASAPIILSSTGHARFGDNNPVPPLMNMSSLTDRISPLEDIDAPCSIIAVMASIRVKPEMRRYVEMLCTCNPSEIPAHLSNVRPDTQERLREFIENGCKEDNYKRDWVWEQEKEDSLLRHPQLPLIKAHLQKKSEKEKN